MTTPTQEPNAPAAPTAWNKRSFWLLNAVMFQGAFSDNVYKLLVTLAGVSVAQRQFGIGTAESRAAEALATGVAGAALVVPFMIVPTFAGTLADRFPKSKITFWTKVLEFVIMCLALVTFGMGHYWAGMAVLFLMGTQSALFSPAKYGILPELVPTEETGRANGLMQGATFVAIISGAVVGPLLFQQFEESLWLPVLLLIVLAGVGAVLARQIVPTPAMAPNLKISFNPIPEVRRNIAEIHAHPGLTMAVGGMVIWWMVGVLLLSTALVLMSNTMKLEPLWAGLAQVPISIGIGLGSVLAGRLCKDRIELGIIPFGAVGMFAMCAVVFALTKIPFTGAWEGFQPHVIACAMGGAGFFAGIFSVPLQSFIITAPKPESRGGVWAAQNFLTAFGMAVGSFLGAFLMGKTMNYTPGETFLVGGIVMLVAGAFMCWRVPEIPMRFLVRFVFGTFYRVRVRGQENIPAEGGALLVCNHQSFLDGILMTAALHRPVRFIMSEDYYRRWFVYPFAKLSNTIPIEGNMSPQQIIHALRTASQAIKDGDLVCIYAEGQITRIGQLLPFRRGYERIMRGTDRPVIPVAIDGLWGSNWSMKDGRLFSHPKPRIKRRPINVAIGAPLPSEIEAPALRAHIVELMVDAFAMRREDFESLGREAIKRMRARPFAPLVADMLHPEWMPNVKALTAAIVLGRKLAPYWKGEQNVGVLLPPGIGALAVNLALAIAGKTSVNINYTMSPEVIARIVKKAKLRTVLSSTLFLEKLAEKNDLRPHFTAEGTADFEGIRTIYLENVRKEITGGDRRSALLAALFAKPESIEDSLGCEKRPGLDDTATLIFSSGSTGDPKGVMLSHWNQISNALGAGQVVAFNPSESMLGILPFFHSFGYLATFWVPVLMGIRVLYFPNPLDGRAIGALIEKYGITFLIATPTFLSGYLRRIEPPQLGSVRFCLTGAEKLRPQLADEFRQRFGILPVEGYGATETSPATSLNSPDARGKGIYQSGSKRGTVGQPIPGVVVRVVDADTREPLPVGTAGMLLVRGANVMQGYYDEPQKTAAVMHGEWYITGDVAKLDEDGFITITDRLSRFSKIGGEMVPHIRVEEALQQLYGSGDPVFCVTAVPDEKKGERLIVLHTIEEARAKEIAQQLTDGGALPNLWVPKASDFFRVDAIPVLGTGKTDLRAVKDLAKQLAG